MKKDLLFEKAVKLRQQGYSYREIHELLGLAKSTTREWLKDISLDASAKMRMRRIHLAGVQQYASRLRHQKELADIQLREAVDRSLANQKVDSGIEKLLCSFLYWAEGAKRGKEGLVFVNSDPVMVKVYLKLLRNSFQIDNSRFSVWLHLHSYHDRSKQIKFWSQIMGIPINQIYVYNKPNSGKNIREGYPGCVSIRYGDTRLFKEIRFIYTIFANKYMGA